MPLEAESIGIVRTRHGITRKLKPTWPDAGLLESKEFKHNQDNGRAATAMAPDEKETQHRLHPELQTRS